MDSVGAARGAPPLTRSDGKYIAFVRARNHWLRRLSSAKSNLLCVVGEALPETIFLPSALSGKISQRARSVSFCTERRHPLLVRESFQEAARRFRKFRRGCVPLLRRCHQRRGRSS